MASSGHFDPSQTYDGYKAAEAPDPAFTDCLMKGKECFQHFNPRSPKCHFFFVEKKPCCLPGVPVSKVRRYLCSKKDGPFGRELPFSEAPTPDGTSGRPPPSSSPTQPPSHNFSNQAMQITPRNLQPVLSTIPSSVPPTSSGNFTAIPSLPSPMRKSSIRISPITKPGPSPVHPLQQLQPVASTSRAREVR
ncbi:hypothetical protein O181_008537 [Austropuccinia psidii MF-1]|uniref:Uncharacterized protein n=1 Tax=Austropuccinia psidii MF-1 TaxID=1389203 RepID=A0A9Q3GJH0_9BASI|nr:hypothetical protein [Austropuccinia psidii MF-1]